MNPTLLFDVQKFHPNAWKIYQEHKEKCFHDSIVSNLKKGIEQGYYRKEMEVDIIAKLRLEQIITAFDPRIFPADKFDISKVQLQFIDHFLHGICTIKGHKLINKYKQINEED
jgi:TetR/AcrR family transcriptional regulator, cholesterol catabolism regulator